KDQVRKFLESCDLSKAGELFDGVTRRATNAQSSGTIPAAQTPFQGSSSRGKAPVRVIRFRAPTVSALPLPNASCPTLSSPHRAEPSVPHIPPSPPSAPTAYCTAPPAPSAYSATPPVPGSYYAQPPQYQHVRQDPAVPVAPVVAPQANSSITREEVTNL